MDALKPSTIGLRRSTGGLRRSISDSSRLETALRTTAAETRAHFDVVAERFRDDVRTIADGYDQHTTVLDDHEARLQRLEQARLRFDG